MPIPKIITAAAERGRKPKTKRQMDNEANNEPQQQPKPQERRGRKKEEGEGRGSAGITGSESSRPLTAASCVSPAAAAAAAEDCLFCGNLERIHFGMLHLTWATPTKTQRET